MVNTEDLEEKYKRYLKKAIVHLEFSIARCEKLPTHLSSCSEEDLEKWESFSSRFARVVDLYLTKLLRLQILKDDPGFDGTLKDQLNFAEKAGWVDSAELYLSFREYRNIQAHDYTEHSFEIFVKGLLKNAPELLKLKKVI
jgi:hypothetical protein